MITIRTIDAHAGGAPVRLVVDGFPAPRGKTMSEKRAWAERHTNQRRRMLMLEPRGHADMHGAVLTEPVTPGSHAGLLFMNASGYAMLNGEAILAATTIALERGLLMPGGDGASVVYDTPAGTVRARAVTRQPASGPLRVERVHIANVPSFVLQGGVTVALGARPFRADIAFGGEFYAIVDAEAAGLPLDGSRIAELRRASIDIAHTVRGELVHPNDPAVRGVAGTIFTGPPRNDTADLRSVTVLANGVVDRSPCATATAAIMAVLDAMELLAPDRPFTHESLIGTRLVARITGRAAVGEYPAIVAGVEGDAWITGEHTFIVEDDDPLNEGFVMTPETGA
jgi:trans-L-3-hydroxyproline dehydratase